ncbi:MAG: RDD family protein [Chloroflexi bacterium]|nr:MAG: RDD family protein [Chloroflexota bacterium]
MLRVAGPSTPDTVRVQTAENVSIGFTTAGLGSRVVAQLIDNVIALPLAYIAAFAYSALAVSASSGQSVTIVAGGALFALFFVYFGYFLVCEVVTGGRTPGKAAMGLRVVRLDGSAPDFVALLIRNVVRVLDVALFAAGIGVVIMFFHPLSRRLGDIAASTIVVRERSRVTLATAAAAPPLITRAPDAGPAVEGIERLGSTEYNALRTFLTRAGLAPELRARLAADIAARMLERLAVAPSAPERFWPPELLLERLYLQLDQRLR